MKKQHLAALQKVYLCLIFSFLYVPIAVMMVFSFMIGVTRLIATPASAAMTPSAAQSLTAHHLAKFPCSTPP